VHALTQTVPILKVARIAFGVFSSALLQHVRDCNPPTFPSSLLKNLFPVKSVNGRAVSLLRQMHLSFVDTLIQRFHQLGFTTGLISCFLHVFYRQPLN
jgi:hypothetical protein